MRRMMYKKVTHSDGWWVTSATKLFPFTQQFKYTFVPSGGSGFIVLSVKKKGLNK